MRLITNVVHVEVERVYIGMVVEVFFEEWTVLGDDTAVWVPMFRPTSTRAVS